MTSPTKSSFIRSTLFRNTADETSRNSDIGPPTSRQHQQQPNDSNDVDFLKDLVHRLNDQLAAYQAKYPGNAPSLKSNEWKTNKQTLSPLLAAYDARVAELEESLSRKDTELQATSAELQSLRHENRRLSPSAAAAGDDFLNSDRIRLLTEENDSLLERLQMMTAQYTSMQSELASARQELESLGEHLGGTMAEMDGYQRSRDEVHALKLQYEADMERVHRESNVLVVENERLLEDVDRMRNDMDETHRKLAECNKQLMELTMAYKKGVRQVERYAQRDSELVGQCRNASLRADEFQSLYQQTASDLDRLQHENGDMVDTMKAMERHILDYENRMVAYQKELDSAVDTLKVAEGERDRLKLREEQLVREVQSMNERIRDINQRHQDTVASEVETFKHHFMNEKKSLLDELSTLQMEKCDTQVKLDRAVREKRLAETEADKIKNQVPAEFDRLRSTIDEYQARIRRAESEMNDSDYRLESLQVKLSREECRFESEKVQLAEEINLITQRLRNAERDADSAKQDRIQLFAKLQESDASLQEMATSLEAAKHETKSLLVKSDRKAEFDKTEWQRKQDQDNAVITKLSKEIQELLVQQQQMAVKWKNDQKSTTVNFERIIEDLEHRLSKSDARYSELNQRYTQLSFVKDELARQMDEHTKSHAKMHTMLKSAEVRGNSSSAQVRALIHREQELINEIKTLQRQNDKMMLETKRIQRQSKLADKRMFNGLPDLGFRKTASSVSELSEHKLANVDAFSESLETSEMSIQSKENTHPT
eukprot:Partr_v1_DN27119_c0_g1_i1_m15417 putative Sodium channel and clathrin linker 1